MLALVVFVSALYDIPDASIHFILYIYIYVFKESNAVCCIM